MTILQKRRERVQRLTQQALKDRQYNKSAQGFYILKQIAEREIELITNRLKLRA